MLQRIIRLVRHATVLVQHALRDLGRPSRSTRWPIVQAMHLAMEPECAACGSDILPQVHHIQPYHLRKELELDLSNLITLCMGPNECHLLVGHGGDYGAYNPAVAKDAWELLNARQRGAEREVARILGRIARKRSRAVLLRPGYVPDHPETLH